MAVVRQKNFQTQEDHLAATWHPAQFPAHLPVHLDKRLDSAQQIAAHLKQQLLTRGTGTPLTLVLPCPLTLAGIYDRGVMEVLDALFELKKQGCQYRVFGLDGDIQLWATEAPQTPQQPITPHAATQPVAAVKPTPDGAGTYKNQVLIVEG